MKKDSVNFQGTQAVLPCENAFVRSIVRTFLAGIFVWLLGAEGLHGQQPQPPTTEEYIEHLLKDAAKGRTFAQMALGMRYEKGDGVPKDAAQAVKWYRLAAEQGDPLGQLFLGARYDKGDGVPKDAVQAVKWYRLAAEQGDALGQFALAAKYSNGDGVLKDKTQAQKWLRLAAENGNVSGQLTLGMMYKGGDGVLRDLVASYFWLNLAAAQGNEIAKNARDELEGSMTKEQISEAQRLSREWVSKKK